MLKTFISNVKLIFGEICGKQRPVPLLSQFVYDGINISVALDEALLNFKNIKFALVQTCLNDLIIYVDQLYMNADEDTRIFILAHEIGHFKCGHFEGKQLTQWNAFLRPFKAKFQQVDQKELDADTYAVNNIGIEKSIHGLEYIVTQLPKNTELIKRLDVLKSM